MTKLPAFTLAGVAAAALAGTAIAAGPKVHVMNVDLPDGSVAHVEYVGEVAPKVSVGTRPMGDMVGLGMPFPSFAGFDRMIAQMQRQSEEMIRHAQQMGRQSAVIGGAPYVAAYANMPTGQTSRTVVTVSNNGQTCTRSTEVVSQGPGRPPKVRSNVSGNCGGAGAQSAKPINRT